jgi:mRNA-degrading endonuclease YafQ of YafQ-DinJ toxin-antitoxin module
MYEIFLPKTKVEKVFYGYLESRGDIKDKLKRLSTNPFRECGAHSLKGNLKGKWSCSLGSNIRMIYTIYVNNKKIIVWSIGSHKIY